MRKRKPTAVDWDYVYKMEREVWGQTFHHAGAPPEFKQGRRERFRELESQMRALDEAIYAKPDPLIEQSLRAKRREVWQEMKPIVEEIANA